MSKISEAIQCVTRKTIISLGEMAHRARQGNGIHRWVSDKVPGATEVVLVDATLYYNIPAGKAVFIKQAWIALLTSSDNVCAALVSCDAVAGGGNATDVSGHANVHSSGNMAGSEHYERSFCVPIVVKYSDGARSISIKVDANDAECKISCGWEGWVESE